MVLSPDPPPTTSKPLRILFVSPEAVPFAKTGGLADVAGALPLALARLGHDVRLVLPRYRTIDGPGHGFREWGRLTVPGGTGPIEATVEETFVPITGGDHTRGVRVFAVRHDPFFDRDGLYQDAGTDYPDNLDRFAFFSRAVLELLLACRRRDQWVPEILHAHDWQTALCPIYLKSLSTEYSELRALRTLFTMHNLGYQGIFPAAQYPKIGLPSALFTPDGVEFYGSLNLMKGGILFADFLSTVSPTYSAEIQTKEYGFGLEGVLGTRRDRLVGIVNGIDTGVWNPEADSATAASYSAANLSGKVQCKVALQKEFGLPARKVPVLVVVSRLASQKGLDLVTDIVSELMGMHAQLIVLGTGESEMEARLDELRSRFPDKIGLRIGFDEGLAHRIEAGGDAFLMPSRYEPCGLSQLISLRYGTVPIVRKTGGLVDTVLPYRDEGRSSSGTGFLFESPTGAALKDAVQQALTLYRDRPRWKQLVRAGMRTDVSWDRSALSYDGLYRRMIESR